jgi:hypothetical protein
MDLRARLRSLDSLLKISSLPTSLRVKYTTERSQIQTRLGKAPIARFAPLSQAPQPDAEPKRKSSRIIETIYMPTAVQGNKNIIIRAVDQRVSQIAQVFEDSESAGFSIVRKDGETASKYFTRFADVIQRVYGRFSKATKPHRQNLLFSILGRDLPFYAPKVVNMRANKLTPVKLVEIFSEMLFSIVKDSDGEIIDEFGNRNLTSFRNFDRIDRFFIFFVKPMPFVAKGGGPRSEDRTVTFTHPNLTEQILFQSFSSKNNNCFFAVLVRSVEKGGFGQSLGKQYFRIKREFGLSNEDAVPIKVARQIIAEYAQNKTIQVVEYHDLTDEFLNSYPNIIVLHQGHYWRWIGFTKRTEIKNRFCDFCQANYRSQEIHDRTCAALKDSFIQLYGEDYITNFLADEHRNKKMRIKLYEVRQEKPEMTLEKLTFLEIKAKAQKKLKKIMKRDDPNARHCPDCHNYRHYVEFDQSGRHLYCYAYEQSPFISVERRTAALDAETRPSLTSECSLLSRSRFAILSALAEAEEKQNVNPERLEELRNDAATIDSVKMYRTIFTHLAVVMKTDDDSKLPDWDRAHDPEMLEANICKRIFEFTDFSLPIEKLEDHLIEQFLDFLITEQRAKRFYQFWAHRGGSFDYIPILGYLYRNLDKYKQWFRPYSKHHTAKCIKLRGTRVLEFNFGLHSFKDSYNFAAMKLDDACNDKNFAVNQSYRKIKMFEHDDGKLKVDDLMFFRPELDFPDYVQALRSSFVSINGKPVSFDQLYTEYNVIDCVALLEVVLKIDHALGDIAREAGFDLQSLDERVLKLSEHYRRTCVRNIKGTYRQLTAETNVPFDCRFGVNDSLTLPGWSKRLFKFIQYKHKVPQLINTDETCLAELIELIKSNQAKVGGVSYVNPNFQGYIHTYSDYNKGLKVNSIDKLDVKGMYSAIMLHCNFPTGSCIKQTRDFDEDDDYSTLGFYLVTRMIAPKFEKGVIHSYPLRGADGSLDWLKDPNPTKENPILMSNVTLARLKRDGYRFWGSVRFVFCVGIVKDKMIPNSYPVFRHFADMFVSKKYEQDQAMALSKDNKPLYTQLVKDKVLSSVNQSLRNMYKLGSNSLYGKTLEDVQPNDFQAIKPGELTSWVNGLQPGNKCNLIWNGNVYLTKVDLKSSFNPLLPYGVLILDYSKDMLFRYLDVFGRKNIASIETDGFSVINCPNIKETLESKTQEWYSHLDDFKYRHVTIAKAVGLKPQVGKMRIGELPGELEHEKQYSSMYNLEKKMCLGVPKPIRFTPDDLNEFSESVDSLIQREELNDLSAEEKVTLSEYRSILSTGTSKGVPKTPGILSKLFSSLYLHGKAKIQTTEFLRQAFAADGCLVQKSSTKVITASTKYL